ncbi:MAG TPA: hypothetical protein VFT68_13195, partial [Lapillicoccus sp.]|nr:hypothetical protein [Lapillicoccus sp.]
RPILTNGTSKPGQSGFIRGFFVLPYQRKDPSPAYVDDGRVDFAGTVPTTVSPGEPLNLSVTIENTGSTSFEPGRGYRLGTQSPADNTDWGTSRFELTESVDPGRVSTQTVSVRAPLDGSPTLQLQLLRESVHWFGEPSAAVPVTVSTPAAVG